MQRTSRKGGGAMNRKERYFPDESRGLFACRILTNILILTTFPVACGIYMKKPPVALLFSGIEMLIFAIAMEVMQRLLKGFGIYTIAHLSVLLLIYVGAPYFAYIHLGFAAAATLVMYYDRAARRRDFYPTPGWLLYPVLIYTVGYVGGSAGLRGMGVFAEIALIALFFLYQNQRGMDRTLTTAKEYVRVPYRKMKVVNAWMFGLFSVPAIVLALIFSQIFNGEVIVLTIGKWIVAGYALLTLAFFWFFSHLIPEGGGDAMAGMDSANIAAMLAAYQEEHPYLSMLWSAFQFIIGVFCLALTVYLLHHFFVEFYRDFRTADLETDDVRMQIVEEKDKLRSRVPKKAARRVGFFTPAAKIRRMYVKYIRRYPRLERIRPSYTPTEIERAVIAHGDARIRELYERARYAPELVTEEQVREMRICCRDSVRDSVRDGS